jgi:SAM-dependent methyltransferase
MTIKRDDPCPLCGSDDVTSFFEDGTRCYLRCLFCRLVFVPQLYWLKREDEKAIYDLHENDAEDLGYRHFLSRLSVPLLEKLERKQRGLDFGSGPGPALSGMLEEHGHHVDLYDPFYCNDPAVFKKKYDFICATEVVEHLREPQREWAALFTMLKPGGWLGIMTKMVRDKHAFSTWHYIRDKTHISFYSQSCMLYLAAHFNAELTFLSSDVILFHKKRVK